MKNDKYIPGMYTVFPKAMQETNFKNKSEEIPQWANKLILAVQNAVLNKQKAEIEVLKKKNTELKNKLTAERRKNEVANMRKEIATVNKMIDSLKPENIRREQFKKMLKK